MNLQQIWDLTLAIGCPFLPLLLMLHNQMTYLPIALHHGGIDGLLNMLPHLPDNVCNILKEQACVIRSLLFDICLIVHISPLPQKLTLCVLMA